jgi:phosphoribosylaminoimidazole-succinocarboxamide synthase
VPKQDKKELYFEGKSKRLYHTEKSDTVVVEFKDETESRSKQKIKIKDRGAFNNEISAYLLEYLEGFHIPTYFLKKISPAESMVKSLDLIPLEIVVRNIAGPAFAKRYGMKDGTDLPHPVIEHYYVNEELHTPFVNDYHVFVLQIASPEELRILNRMASKTNAVLRSLCERRRLKLVDCSLRFGRHKGQILLGDEITPETCRFWDVTGRRTDKDRFRIDGSESREVYEEIRNRIVRGVSS